MDVVSSCPLRVAAVPWQPRAGAWSLAVVCKATYTLAPDESPLADEQDEPVQLDAHFGDDSSRSLRVATDLVPFKKRAEVIVVGHAHAPGGRPVSSLTARFVVGNIDKTVEVVADRAFTSDGHLVTGPAFTRVPLRWERAAGGPGTPNPIGVRADARPDVRGRIPLPNLQRPGALPARPGEAMATIGFGPIAPSWPERWARRQRVDAAWDHRTWPDAPLPGHLDAGFFNAAPRDQQLDVLRSNTRIVLENLHPLHPRLVTTLAGVSPVAEVDRGEGSPERVALRCDTLWIDADRGACTLTWRAQIPIADPASAGRVTISIAQSRRSASSAGTIVGGAPARALPFTTAEAAPFAAAEATAEATPLATAEATPPPFARVEAARPELTATRRSEDPPPLGGQTVELDNSGAFPAMPFRVGRSPLMGTVLGTKRTIPPPPPNEAEAGELESIEIDLDEEADVEEATRTGELPPRPSPRLPSFAPPRLPSFAPPRLPSFAPTPAPASSSPPPSPSPAPPAETGISIARCAAISASIARRRDDAGAVLDAYAVTAAELDDAERRFAEGIADEAARGRRALLDAYDDAYVTRLEEERGPLGPAEHARIAVAAERGALPAALAALSLPRDAAVRIERVMLRRALADPDLARRHRLALAAERSGAPG